MVTPTFRLAKFMLILNYQYNYNLALLPTFPLDTLALALFLNYAENA